ncbi:glycosyltransferase family 4 protein [Flavobacteriaceae bacterium F08102]|nr:glycosyltransferase family 4 protein [Flavobacteriaceae bacterium F08102]
MNTLICMVVDGAYPEDIRVRKEAETLVASGFEVLVVCPKKKGLPREEVVRGVRVKRIGNHYATFKKGVHDMFESIFNINLFFYFPLRSILKKENVVAIHVHDLPLAGTVYRFKTKHRTMVLDLHENYPEALKTWFLWRSNRLIKFKNSIFMRPSKWRRKEEKYVKLFDVVICVVEEMKEKLIRNFSVNLSKLIVVSNMEKKSFVRNYEKLEAQDLIKPGDFAITYVGGFGPHRGLDTAIEAMPEIQKTIPNAKLFLVGSGHPDVLAVLKNKVDLLNLQQCVVFAGQRPFKEVASIMCSSAVNIIPHHSNDHTDHTIPHKLFQIMLSKRPLVVSSCTPLQRIVKTYDAGYVFKASDAFDFARTIVRVYQDPEKAIARARNAFIAVAEKGENWEREGEKLVTLYKQLVN